jgi:hypothetical protein
VSAGKETLVQPTARQCTSPRRFSALVVTVMCGLALTAVAGCKSIDQPNTRKAEGNVSAPTVQATLTAEATSAPAATATPQSGQPSGESAAVAVPPKVSAFAKAYPGQAWYPASVPAGFKTDSLDVVEMEPKTGLVCDIVYLKGGKVIQFTQGSPTARDYEIVSVGKTAWGDQQADIVHEDPSDTASRKMIVLRTGDTLAELGGTVDFETLKSVAASMVPMK